MTCFAFLFLCLLVVYRGESAFVDSSGSDFAGFCFSIPCSLVFFCAMCVVSEMHLAVHVLAVHHSAISFLCFVCFVVLCCGELVSFNVLGFHAEVLCLLATFLCAHPHTLTHTLSHTHTYTSPCPSHSPPQHAWHERCVREMVCVRHCCLHAHFHTLHTDTRNASLSSLLPSPSLSHTYTSHSPPQHAQRAHRIG